MGNPTRDQRSGQPPLEAVLSRLQGVKQSGDGYTARCPAHDDANPSLSVKLGDDGKVLLKCHSNKCSVDSIVAAMGLLVRDLFPQSNGAGRRVVATYDYTDEQGQLLFQAVRYDPKDFRQRRPDGKGGHVYKLGDVRRVLYRLRELIQNPDQPVVICEGEKDCDTLAKIGLLATTCPMGAGKWGKLDSETVAKALGGRDIFILPDNDDAGRKHAADVAKRLKGNAKAVYIVNLPGLSDKGDVSDWLNIPGNTPTLLKKILAEEAQRQEAQPPAADKAETPTSTASQESSAARKSDVGNAERLVRRHGGDILHCHPTDTWYIHDGTRYKADDTGEIVRRAKETLREEFTQVVDDQKAARTEDDLKAIQDHAKFLLRSENAPRVKAMIELARCERHVQPDALDADPMLLNVINGTIDLRTGKIREHRREDFITRLAPVTFDPAATCPMWLKFLNRIIGKPTLIAYLRRLVGHFLTGDVGEQSLWFFHGTGANGKTVFIQTVLALLGDYAIQAVSDLLLERRHDPHPTERMDLFGRRLAATTEIDQGKRLAESLTKQLTGGDKVRARKMRQDGIEFRSTAKLVLAANHKPTIKGTDHAIWRRVKLVPFTVTIPDAEQDRKLADKLRGELSGILTWAVQGCLEWQRDGMQTPEEVVVATADYRKAEDVIGRFVAECCVIGPGLECKAADLYKRYKVWAADSGDKYPLSQTKFGEALVEPDRGLERYTSNGTRYKGLGLPDTCPDDDSDGRELPF